MDLKGKMFTTKPLQALLALVIGTSCSLKVPVAKEAEGGASAPGVAGTSTAAANIERLNHTTSCDPRVYFDISGTITSKFDKLGIGGVQFSLDRYDPNDRLSPFPHSNFPSGVTDASGLVRMNFYVERSGPDRFLCSAAAEFSLCWTDGGMVGGCEQYSSTSDGTYSLSGSVASGFPNLGLPVNYQLVDNDHRTATQAGAWSAFATNRRLSIGPTYAYSTDGSATMNWSFANLDEGRYLVYATHYYHALATKKANFRLTDGTTTANFVVDQTLPPGPFNWENRPWQVVGELLVSKGVLNIQLSNDDQGGSQLMVDSILLARKPALIFDTSATSPTGGPGVQFFTGIPGTLPMIEGDAHGILPNSVGSYVEWPVAGLTAGRTYRLSATWYVAPVYTKSARFEVRQGNRLVASTLVAEDDYPKGVVADGRKWNSVGTVVAGSEPISVRVVAAIAAGHVVADAIRADEVSVTMGQTATIDDNDANGFSSLDSSVHNAGNNPYIYNYDTQFCLAGAQCEATYDFSAMPAGQFEIYADWYEYSDRRTEVIYQILNAHGQEVTRFVRNQRLGGKDLFMDAIWWKRLGLANVGSQGFKVRVFSNVADGQMLLDGIHVRQVVAPVAATALPKATLKIMDNGSLRVTWDAVAGATRYEMVIQKYNTSTQRYDVVLTTDLPNPRYTSPVTPGNYRIKYRVLRPNPGAFSPYSGISVR